jgi:hypothetical protein
VHNLASELSILRKLRRSAASEAVDAGNGFSNEAYIKLTGKRHIFTSSITVDSRVSWNQQGSQKAYTSKSISFFYDSQINEEFCFDSPLLEDKIEFSPFGNRCDLVQLNRIIAKYENGFATVSPTAIRVKSGKVLDDEIADTYMLYGAEPSLTFQLQQIEGIKSVRFIYSIKRLTPMQMSEIASFPLAGFLERLPLYAVIKRLTQTTVNVSSPMRRALSAIPGYGLFARSLKLILRAAGLVK